MVTTRAHVHYIVTEYGIAYLFGKNLRQRAHELIRIAHPDHREALEAAAFERLKCMPSPDWENPRRHVPTFLYLVSQFLFILFFYFSREPNVVRKSNNETISNFKMRACKVSLHVIEYFKKLVFINCAISDCLVIDKIFSQWEAKPVPPCRRDFSRALSKSQATARNSDWLIALFTPVMMVFGKISSL